jgi:putative transposase
MSNHLHLVVVPRKEDSLARGIGEAHRRYTQTKNSEADVRGYLFQGRFGSYVMDEPHLLAAVRYVELNPVVAGMVNSPGAYRWSSARFHLGKQPKDPLVEDRRLLGLVSDWEKYLGSGMEELERRRVEQHLRTGRPRGDDRFVSRLEGKLGRVLRPKKRGWREGHRREVSGK